MCLAELMPGAQAVSLGDLWAGALPDPQADPGLDERTLAEFICVGGWPSNIGRTAPEAMELNRSYLRVIAGTDIVTLDGVRRDPLKVEALIWALARSSASYVSLKTLQSDTARYGGSIDPKTLTNYLDALLRLWVAVEQPAWGGHLRSSAQARRSPKRHLVDPSLATAALNLTASDLLTDRETFGILFESLVFRDLTVLADTHGLGVRCFQDKTNREMDAVLLQGTSWAGIEVKLAPTPDNLDQAATGLLRIAAAMDTKPRFLATITGPGPTYRRPDGVLVLALAHLGV
jgi:predicted AAA+ superfamily ATPase